MSESAPGMVRIRPSYFDAKTAPLSRCATALPSLTRGESQEEGGQVSTIPNSELRIQKPPRFCQPGRFLLMPAGSPGRCRARRCAPFRFYRSQNNPWASGPAHSRQSRRRGPARRPGSPEAARSSPGPGPAWYPPWRW